MIAVPPLLYISMFLSVITCIIQETSCQVAPFKEALMGLELLGLPPTLNCWINCSLQRDILAFHAGSSCCCCKRMTRDIALSFRPTTAQLYKEQFSTLVQDWSISLPLYSLCIVIFLGCCQGLYVTWAGVRNLCCSRQEAKYSPHDRTDRGNEQNRWKIEVFERKGLLRPNSMGKEYQTLKTDGEDLTEVISLD